MLRALTFALVLGVAAVPGTGLGLVSLAQAQAVDYTTMSQAELAATIVEVCEGPNSCEEIIAAIAAAVGPEAAAAAVQTAAATSATAAGTIQTAAANVGLDTGTGTPPGDVPPAASGLNVGSINDGAPGDNGGDSVGTAPPASGS